MVCPSKGTYVPVFSFPCLVERFVVILSETANSAFLTWYFCAFRFRAVLVRTPRFSNIKEFVVVAVFSCASHSFTGTFSIGATYFLFFNYIVIEMQCCCCCCLQWERFCGEHVENHWPWHMIWNQRKIFITKKALRLLLYSKNIFFLFVMRKLYVTKFSKCM